MRDAREIVLEPVVTEKSTQLMEDNTYAFIVAKDANKIQIRNAVERLFDVRVRKVWTMNFRGKYRRVGQSVGQRPSYKKALVRLNEGETIDVYEGI